MTEMLTRPVQDNRMLRQTAGLQVGLSPALSELWGTPGWYALEKRQAAITRAAESVQGERLQIGEDFIVEMNELAQEFAIAPQEDRPAIIDRLEELKARHSANLSAETQRRIDEGSMATPEELNKEYGEWGLSFDRPMAREEARLIYEGKKAEVIRESIVGRSPQGVLPTAAKFGVGLAAMATDPLELATMFIPVVGPAKTAALVARYGRVGGRAIVGGVEGLVGSALTEPAYYGLSRDMQLDYAMSDALLNVGLGAILGGGLGAVIGRASRETPRIDAERVDLPIDRTLPTTERSIDLPDRAADLPVERAQANIAIRQVVTDQAVDIAPAVMRVGRPQTLSEFVRSVGGINDSDPAFKGELIHAGIRHPIGGKGGISNPKSELNLDDAAALAHEAGFIPDRDPSMLVDKLKGETDGRFSFAIRDADRGEEWRAWRRSEEERISAESRREGIVSDLESAGVQDLQSWEIDAVEAAVMRGSDPIDAFERITVKAYNEDSDRMVEYAMSENFDTLADPQASQRFEAMDVSDPEVEIAEYEAMVNQIDEADLTPESRAELAEIKEMEAHANDYANAVEAAAACVARS